MDMQYQHYLIYAIIALIAIIVINLVSQPSGLIVREPVIDVDIQQPPEDLPADLKHTLKVPDIPPSYT